MHINSLTQVLNEVTKSSMFGTAVGGISAIGAYAISTLGVYAIKANPLHVFIAGAALGTIYRLFAGSGAHPLSRPLGFAAGAFTCFLICKKLLLPLNLAMGAIFAVAFAVTALMHLILVDRHDIKAYLQQRKNLKELPNSTFLD